jgi:hypothetical protein
LASLDEGTQEWWEDELTAGREGAGGDNEPYGKNASGLKRFLKGEVLSWYSRRQREIEKRYARKLVTA